MNYAKIDKCDTANGEGVRVSLFVSGCSINCPGCFNKPAQDFKFGKEFSQDTLDEILNLCESPYISGLSLLGGDPLHPKNVPTISSLVKAFRQRFRDTKTIWCWTGYTLEQLKERGDPSISYILDNIDVLVDGPFVESLKDPSLSWRGSSNQRVLLKPYTHPSGHLTNSP